MVERLLKEAVLYETLAGGLVKCQLCNFKCVIKDGQCGVCGVRKNLQGKLFSLNYHSICAAAADPVEKKPLYHFLPASKSFSIAAVGCNFSCRFCQNWQISQIKEDDIAKYARNYKPAEIVEAAIETGCDSISYTYTEPTVFMELTADCGIMARQAGLKNIFVSNGYMTRDAVDFMGSWLDAINIDLKAFNEGFYSKLCQKGAKLSKVIETISYIAEKTEIWTEVTTLIIAGENDSEEEIREMASFIAGLRNGQLPWHISRFYPNYQMQDKSATNIEIMRKIYDIARQEGVKYVYTGNTNCNWGSDTICPGCGSEVIKRQGFDVTVNQLKKGICDNCGEKIAGIF